MKNTNIVPKLKQRKRQPKLERKFEIKSSKYKTKPLLQPKEKIIRKVAVDKFTLMKRLLKRK